jgi:hypothetical protein
MKWSSFRWAGLLLVAGSLCMIAPGLHAQSQQQPQQQQPPEAAQQAQTFAGIIMKLQDGKYALVTGKTQQGQLSGHFLDDQDTAKKYEGKKVTVTGSRDMASNTIHVTKIEAA